MRDATESGRSDGGPMHRVLVAGAEPDLNAVVTYHLARAGYRVSTAATGQEAIDTTCEERPTLIVLDAVLMGLSSYDVLVQLRQREETSDVGVLFLTTRERESDRVKSLTLGADDCLARPFSAQELVLRVGAIVRRLTAPEHATGSRLSAGPIVFDRTAHRVVHGVDVNLTATEFKLLRALMQREGRLLSRAELLQSVWGAPADVATRTVDMHMQRLRHKLGGAGRCIETVRGAGYRFQRPHPRDGRGRSRTAKDGRGSGPSVVDPR
jgi:two-component system phosphate regulon response regulator PhoB